MMLNRYALRWLLAFIVIGSLPAALADTESRGPTPDAASIAAVKLDGEVLFQLRGISALPPQQRADLVRANIIDVARDLSVDPSAGKMEARGEGIGLVFGNKTVVIFYSSDADIEGVQLSSLVLGPIKDIGMGIVGSLPDLAFLAVLFVVIRFFWGSSRHFLTGFIAAGYDLRVLNPNLPCPPTALCA
jgi:hypothetical protein